MIADHHNNMPAARRTLDTLAVRNKVEEDITFLQMRISMLEKHSRPNRIVLDTYQNMLNSRIAVLKWLQDGNSPETNCDKRRA